MNLRIGCVSAAVALLACGSSSPQPRPCDNCSAGPRVWPPSRPGYVNPIPAENALPGDDGWSNGRASFRQAVAPLTRPSAQVELYADRVSTTAGKTVQVMVSIYDPGTAQQPGPIAHSVAWSLYRVGWYGGSGARKLLDGAVSSVGRQADCPMQAGTGLVRCAWTPTFSFTLPQDAVSGIYVVKVLRDDGWVSFTPLIVTDSRVADLLFQASVNTWQAYNDWGGESLYRDASGTLPAGQKFAVQVSFERPYAGQRGLSDAAHLHVPFARFMERNGYDVTYTTNLDVAKGGAAYLQAHGMFLSTGHDEYWPGEERAAADQALAAGVPMAFFGANPAYWKVRLEGALGPESAPLITCYKNRPQDDPMGLGATGMFRSAAIHQPESELVGVMYDGYQLVLFPWVVADATTWLFAGTSVKDGDSFHNLVGNEFDRRFDGLEPAGVTLHARSPVIDALGRPNHQEAASYRAASQALVFGAGTIYWAHGLNRSTHATGADPAYDPRLERITANVFQEALGLPVPAGVDQGAEPKQPVRIGAFATAVETVVSGLQMPLAVAERAGGDLVVAEAPSNADVDPNTEGYRPAQILQVTQSGQVRVLAGPSNGFAGSQGFYYPSGLAVANDTVYVADTFDHVIRAISPSGQVTTFAGVMHTSEGSGGQFTYPMGLALDPAGKTLYVADSGGAAVKAVDLVTGAVTTVASGIANPTAVAAAPDGRIFVVRVVGGSPGVSAILPGGTVVPMIDGAFYADGLASQGAGLGDQLGAVWANGGLVLSDATNQLVRVVKPGSGTDEASLKSSTQVYTYAGAAAFGSADGAAETATFQLPLGLGVGLDGKTVYVADAGAGAVRVIRP
jgi:DNA-binding beta-propeller fold protein YncE